MAKRQSVSWVELRVGILVIASFALLAATIFFVGGETGFFTPTYGVTVYFGSASGMNTGTEVWLEGVTVGNVRSVQLTNFPEPNRSVAVQLSIDQSYQELIRTNSIVTIGTIGLLGDKIIEIARGDGEIVPDGGSIQGQSGGDIREIITGTNDIIANLEVLSEQVQVITTRIQQGEGTLGRILTDDAIFDNVNATVQEANRLMSDARTGDGTIGRLMSDDALYTSLNTMVQRVDTLLTRVENGEGTLGRFLQDPTLYNEANRLVAQVGLVVDRLERGEGTLGRLSRDEALYQEAQRAMTGISSMVQSVANSEGTAGRLINDPALYNNVNMAVSELLKLVYDFRQDPQRFLTINFRLF